MAEFIHRTDHVVSGPFLIDRAQLEALDKILKDEWERFEEHRKHKLETAIAAEFAQWETDNSRVEYSDVDIRDQKTVERAKKRIRERAEDSREFRARKEFILFLTDGSAAKVADFTSAFREADLQDKVPNGLYADLESGEHSCEVQLSGSNSPRLKVEVQPRRNQFVQQTLMALKNWQSSVRPPMWQNVWIEFKFVPWVLWFMATIVSLFLLDMRAESNAGTQFSQEAVSLITNNINSQNQNRAIQLLLAKSYNYQTQPTTFAIPGWLYLLIFGGLAYAIALSYSPKISIAVGRGERDVRFWRKYSVFILITTPGFIFTTFMWPKIEHFLHSIF